MELETRERCLLDDLVRAIPEERLLQPGLEGDRSIKDILAHITDWEQRIIQWINESCAGMVPQRPTPGMNWDNLDKLNEQIYLANKDKSLSQILSASSASYLQSLQVL